MHCKIAELNVEIPEAGGMAPRCRDYLTNEATADIVLKTEDYMLDVWPGLSYDNQCYMESGALFYIALLKFGGMMLHASAVEYEGQAYLFSGPCGVGKSTHTRLWKQVFGEGAQVFNDDKPALRLIDGQWYAYGTPWCGKDGINQNKKVPLAGICFLKQSDKNSIRPLNAKEAVIAIMGQTWVFFNRPETLQQMTQLLDKLVRQIPIWELENVADPAAAQLSYETMRHGKKT